MRRTLNYTWKTISLLLSLLVCLPAFADRGNRKQGERPQAVFYGFYVDLDVLDPIIHIFYRDRMGLDASIQADLFHRLYPSFTIGYHHFDASGKYNYPIPAENCHYEVNGLYYKVGVAANVWRKNFRRQLNPIAYVGANFGWSPRFSSDLSGYPVDNQFWNGVGERQTFSLKYDKNRARWMEILVGMKAPVAKKFCLGGEVMFKPFLSVDKVEQDGYSVQHSYAPGYGSKKNGKWSFRYTLSYYFSFFKGGASDSEETY